MAQDPAVGASIPENVEPYEGELPADPEVGDVIGGYELVELLGKGGAGAVFRATSPNGEVVSLKVLASSKLRKARLIRRFLDEARTAAMVEHTALVRLIEFIVQEEPCRLAYAMEFVDGESLRQKLNRERALDLAAAIRIALQICDGVGALHERGIIHRDLKPENIMLVGDPAGPKVKLLDYGVAKVVGTESDDSVEGPGTFVGTPRYMAPEQAAGGAVDPRSDLFALGVIIFEMVTGKRPHEGDSLKAVVMAKLQGAPRVTINPDKEVLPRGLSDAVDACLKLQPSSRPDSAKALALALDEALAVLFVVGSIRLGQDGATMVRVQRPESLIGRASHGAPGAEHELPPEPKGPSKLALKISSAKQRLGAAISKIGVKLRIGAALASVRKRLAERRASQAAKPVDPNGLRVRLGALVAKVGPKRVFAGAVGIVVVVTGVAVVLFAPGSKAPGDEKGLVSTATTAAPVRPHAPRTAHVVNVSTRPPGALVFVGSSTIGKTPLDLTVAPGAEELRVELRLDGYRAVKLTVSRTTTTALRLEMPPLPAAKGTPLDAGVPDTFVADAASVDAAVTPTGDAAVVDAGGPQPIPKEILELIRGDSSDISEEPGPRRRSPPKPGRRPVVKPPPPADALPPADAIP
ncbi:MAG: serine/threonine protein kinase [Deltaproteobacteria bacterium]|nr:serine/threonine protein kinase [Deltaproteobacteria bacterium]